MDQDWNKRLSALQKSIETDNFISEGNRKLIFEHLDFLKANGKNVKTAIKHLYSLRSFMKGFEKDLDLRKATRKDMERAMGNLNSSNLSEETKRDVKAIVKQLYKEMLGEGLYYPPVVAWIKTTSRNNRRMLPEDILSEDEIIGMIGKANNVRDKAIIALLFDSGIRAGELLSMRKKDVDLASEPMHITVNGKTGMRRIPILFSGPYLGSYLGMMKETGPNDPLWWNLAQSHIKGPLDGPGLRRMLRMVAEAAGIQKRMYPHLFRHSRASSYANRLTEQQLKMYFGWTGDSKMAATYVHLSGRDIDNAILQAHGMKPKDNSNETKMKIRRCPRCRTDNPLDAMYCVKCGGAMEIDIAYEEEQMRSRASRMGREYVRQPDIKRKVVRKVADSKTPDKLHGQ